MIITFLPVFLPPFDLLSRFTYLSDPAYYLNGEGVVRLGLVVFNILILNKDYPDFTEPTLKNARAFLCLYGIMKTLMGHSVYKDRENSFFYQLVFLYFILMQGLW